MEIVQSKSVVKPVILMKILDDNTLLVVDAETAVRYFNKENLELQNGFKVGVTYKRYKTPVVAFSNDGNYFALLSLDLKESRLFSTQTKKMITKVDRHHGEVSCVAIDPLSRYMFSCGDDGKSFAFDIESGKLVFTLPPHADTINDIAFSGNGNWVATASYDRKISLFSLVTMTPKNKLKSHSAPVMHLKFFHRNKLISIDKKSSAIIWNIYSGKVLNRLQGIHDEVTALVLDGEERFLFLGTQLGYIIVFDLKTYKLISAKYIKITSPVTSLAFDKDNDFLIIGTADGFVIYYDIFEGTDTLKKLLQEKEFGLVQKVIDINPLLVYTQIYSLIANFWENSLQKAKIALQKGDRAKAMLIFGQFKHMPSKNKIIQKLIRDYTDFPKFVQFAKEGKLALAYGLANRFPVYKESATYKALEKRWKKAFFQAQQYVLDPKTAPLAKEILAPYRGMSEKTKFIQEVLSKAEIYKRFRNAISKKEFTICSELIKQNPFLRELPEYESLMKYADGLYIKSQKFMQEGELHSAIKILRILQDFEGFKDEARNFMIDLESKAKFFNAVRDNDMETAYDMMAVSEDLMQTKDGVKLQQMWNKDLHTANAAAAFGNINGVKAVMQKYMRTSSKYAALATVFAFAYMVQLEDALQRGVERPKIENSIKNYVVNFGVSEQIEAFFNLFQDMYPETKLNLEFLKKGSFTMWRPSMIVDSILD
ncbi:MULTISPECIES: WD40 repeat domain-containing protein [Sulfurimonas]|uniref:WD40 repeat domain-containing protein n=1 Tax=Sulfurimonas TaxID=202746 RepID=UPI00126495AD|nr:WD40 repeat domain-containing protein [Sulfurimonas indica]